MADAITAKELSEAVVGQRLALSKLHPALLNTTEKQTAVAALATGYQVENNFDPSVSGLEAAVGSIAQTKDLTKTWKKWGAGDTNWVALHATTGVLAAASATFDVPLYCATAGGFRLDLDGITTDAIDANHCSVVPRINGVTQLSSASIMERWAAWSSSIVSAPDRNLVGGTGIWFDAGDYGFASIQCKSPAASVGRRRLELSGTHNRDGSGTAFSGMHLIAPAASGEITSVGIALVVGVGGTPQIQPGMTWRLERFR